MSRSKLRSGDIALLRRLNAAPLEIGDLPVDSVARLTALGLARKVLGCCEITRKGQLTLHRQHFLPASRRRVARVTRGNPLFLQESSFATPASRTRLSNFIRMWRSTVPHDRQKRRLPRWLARLASEAAGGFRLADERPANPRRPVRAKLKRDSQQGSE